MSIGVWLRAIRARFLVASVIAVGVGIASSWYRGDAIDALNAALTLAGVLALHASVDLFNDYWDHKRGIDANTTRTPFSGGTGVIRDGTIPANTIRTAGITMMVIGLGIGAYFVVTHGPIIALILAFAVISVYFYSTRIVDSGLAEVFVASKGALITVGASFIQSGELTGIAAAAGICVGILSSLVLFVTSFPDHDADKLGGRKTLVVIMGRKHASSVFWVFPAAFSAIIIAAIYAELLPIMCAIALGALPLAYVTGRMLHNHHSDTPKLVPVMRNAVLFSRITGVLILVGLVVSHL